MILSPFVTWLFSSLSQSEVSLWIWQSLWWSPLHRPTSGCSAGPFGGPSVTYGPGLRGGALSELDVKGLLAVTPSSGHWAWTLVEIRAGASAEWNALFWKKKGEKWRKDGLEEERLISFLNCISKIWLFICTYQKIQPSWLHLHAALR